MSTIINENAAGGNQAANSLEKTENFNSNYREKSDFSKELSKQNSEENAFCLVLAKGTILKSLTKVLKGRYEAHFNETRNAWCIPKKAGGEVEKLLKEKGLKVELRAISDDYYRKTENGKRAEQLWVRIGFLENRYYKDHSEILTAKHELEKEITIRNLADNNEDVVKKQKEIEGREAEQISLRNEIDQLRASAKLFEEENLIDDFLVRGGKTHEAAAKGIAILSNPDCGVFQYRGKLVRIIAYQTSPKKEEKERVSREEDALTISLVDEIFLSMILSQKHSWISSRNNTPIDFPDKAARQILSNFSSETKLQIPYLKGFVCCPTLRANGSLLEKEGYDENSGLYFNPCGTKFPKIPENPTKEDAISALDILLDLIKDFPFADEVSQSVALAELMTGVIRRSLDVAPPFANDASTKSSGKTLLARLVSYIATGKTFSMITPTPNEEEMEKRYAAALIAGDLILCIDNVDFVLEDRCLCAITTNSEWRPRILGKSKNATVDTNALFIFTGNNFSCRGDLCSRFLKCRILPNCERPEERKFDRDLDEYTLKNRDRLVAAILTIIRAYVVAGFPQLNQLIPFRTYSSFTRFVRGPLVWLGKPDPYESSKEIKENDPEIEEIGALLAAWHEVLKFLAFEFITVKKLIEIATDLDQRKSTLELGEAPIQTLYEVLVEQFPSEKDKEKINAGNLGAKLAKIKGRIVRGYQLQQLMKSNGKEPELDRKGKAQWRVVIH